MSAAYRVYVEQLQPAINAYHRAALADGPGADHRPCCHRRYHVDISAGLAGTRRQDPEYAYLYDTPERTE